MFSKRFFYTFVPYKNKTNKIMKKIYTLAIALIGALTFAQTPLNTNGSLETWTDGTVQADGWFMNFSLLTNGAIERLEGDAQDGDVYVKLTAPETSNNQLGLADIAVTGGTEYTVTYWYRTGDSARFRFWGQWRTDSAAISVSNDPFQSGTYMETTTQEWTKVTITSTAPADATVIRITFRNYSGGGDDLFIDNVVFYEVSAAIKDNNIAGLSIYPNPATGSVLNVTSHNNIEKSVAIFDVLGKQVINTKTVNGSVNIADLNAGVYIVKVTEEGKTATRKLVVK